MPESFECIVLSQSPLHCVCVCVIAIIEPKLTAFVSALGAQIGLKISSHLCPPHSHSKLAEPVLPPHQVIRPLLTLLPPFSHQPKPHLLTQAPRPLRGKPPPPGAPQSPSSHTVQYSLLLST